MDADRLIELRLGRPDLCGDGDALDLLAGVGPDHVGAEDALARAVDDQLHEDTLLLLGERELQGAEVRLVDVDLAGALACLFLGQAHRRKVRVGKYGGFDRSLLDPPRPAPQTTARPPYC